MFVMRRSINPIVRGAVIGFAVLALIAIGVQIWTVRRIDNLADLTTRIYDHPLAVSNALLQANTNIAHIQIYLERSIVSRNDDEFDAAIRDMQMAKAEFLANIDIVRGRFLGDISNVENVVEIFNSWESQNVEIVEVARTKGELAAKALNSETQTAYITDLSAAMDILIIFAANKAAEFEAGGKDSQSDIRLVINLVFWAGVGIGLLILSYVVAKISGAENRLRASEDRYRAVIDSQSDIICRWLPDETLSFVNTSYEKLYGLPSRKLIGKPIGQQVNPVDRVTVSRSIREMRSGSGPLTVETEIFGTDGEAQYFSWNITAVFDGNGAPVEYQGVGRDITRQKNIEAALQESEERYRLAATTSSDAIWDRTVADGKTYISDRLGEMLGYDLGELPSEAETLRSLLHPDERDEIIRHFEAFLAGDQAYLTREYRLRKKDGGYRLFSVKTQLVRSDKGEVERITGILRDITDERSHEQQLHHAQKMQAVGELGGGIAHDFNNILSIVLGNLELLKSNCRDDSKALNRIDTALRGVSRGAALTESLLRFSRVEPKKKIRTSANQCIIELQDMIEKSVTVGVNVTNKLADDLWAAEFDPGEFGDVIVNLALNARDAMPDGGILTFETENKVLDEDYAKLNPGSSAGEFVMVSVCDTGMGMTNDVKERIFEPFFSTKERGKGTGLGLSMTYGFVEQSGGHIKVYSEPGRGTTFRLYLPRAIGVGESAVWGKLEAKNLPQGTETVLVVDDEADLASVAVSHLEGLGYRTLIAHEGARALEIIRGPQGIDLLFSDVVMPNGVDGFQLAENAKKIRPDIKILLTSGFAADWSQQELGDSTFRAELVGDLLRKPYSKAELAKRIRARLGPHE